MIERYGGVVVKSLGDGILAAFDAEQAAVGAALEMLSLAPRHRLQVHVGVQCGDVLVEGGDMFGQAVNTASRLSAMARPSEVLVTRDVLDRLPALLRGTAQRLQNMPIKGLHDPLELYALTRADPSATRSAATTVDQTDTLPTFGLEIRLGTDTWNVAPLSGLHMGRHQSNDLVVTGDHVSRRHAMIVTRRGKYVLVDQSVNGTWLAADDGTCVHLLREEATLHGAGAIYLGQPPDRTTPQPISYRTLARPGP